MNKNKNKITDRIFHPMVITINLAILLFIGNAGTLLNAQTGSTDTTAAPTGEAQVPANEAQLETECQTKINEFVDVKFKEFQGKMENHFKSKDSTTSLLDDAILEYENYKKSLYDELYKFENDHNPGASQDYQLNFLTNCRSTVEKSIQDARIMLGDRAETTSGIKKTTAFLEKYKEINGKLRNLDMEFIKMQTNLATFAQKLPCYIKKACNRS